MAKVGDGTLVKWVDGQDVDAVDINRNFEVLRVANNDTDDKAVDAKQSIDSKVDAVQDDLNAKYQELVQVDTDAANLFVTTIADIRDEFSLADQQIITDYTNADADLQTQVNDRPTNLQTDQKISDAIATIVTGNAIIPVGSTFPDPGNGRINGEEFILQNPDNTFKLYFYNIIIGAWVSAYDYLTVPSATTFSKGIVQLTDDNTGGSRNMAPTQRALANHVNDTTPHVTQADKDNWNGKVSATDTANWQKYKLTEDTGRSIFKGTVDVNTLVNNGQYSVFSNSTNLPLADDFFIDVYRYNETFIVQVARRFTVNSYYTRSMVGSSWGTWSADLFTSVANGKTAIASAITAKGVATASDASFSTMASNISAITTDPKILTGNMGTGIVSSGVNAGLTFNIPGLPKTPVAFKVTMSNMQYVSGSGTTNYSLNTPIEFVYNLTNRVATLTGTNPPFSFIVTVSGTQLTIYVQYSTGTVTTVRYSLDAFTAIY